MRNLKPCPFCGGKAVESYNGEWRYITCSVCFAKGEMLDVTKHPHMSNQACYDDCAALWNKRYSKSFARKILKKIDENKKEAK